MLAAEVRVVNGSRNGTDTNLVAGCSACRRPTGWSCKRWVRPVVAVSGHHELAVVVREDDQVASDGVVAKAARMTAISVAWAVVNESPKPSELVPMMAGCQKVYQRWPLHQVRRAPGVPVVSATSNHSRMNGEAGMSWM